MPRVKCKHCGRIWDYLGKSKRNATCPDCQNKTPIEDTEGERKP